MLLLNIFFLIISLQRFKENTKILN